MKKFAWLLMPFVGLTLLVRSDAAQAHAQSLGITQQQLAAVIPDEQDLQGLSRIRPAGETPLLKQWSETDKTWIQPTSSAEVIADHVVLDRDLSDDWTKSSAQAGVYSQCDRGFYSDNGLYQLHISVTVYDTPETAHGEMQYMLHGAQAVYQKGTFSGSQEIGDESWFYPGTNRTLIFRYGRVVVNVDGAPSFASSHQNLHFDFPASAIEAVASTILLRMTRQANITGMRPRPILMAVNGKPLDAISLISGGQTFVPVTAFAKAMGYTSRWNAKTGGLTLSQAGRKPIILTAGSLAATVGTNTVALQTPVLKQDGQPVMALQDLLTLMNGRITRRQGNDIQVTV